MSKIIQITGCSNILIALCEDGSLWKCNPFSSKHWEKLDITI